VPATRGVSYIGGEVVGGGVAARRSDAASHLRPRVGATHAEEGVPGVPPRPVAPPNFF
jgi:hypothetical protein